MKIAVALVVSLWASTSFAEPCAELIDQAETVSSVGLQDPVANKNDLNAAKATAQNAVKQCLAEHVKSARPYMVLATIANVQHDFAATVSWSKQALTQEPGLGLAYMDMGAGYMGMKKYDEAIAVFKEGLKTNHEWSAKLNFNLGLAIFKKEVDAQRFAKAADAEPYFVACTQLDPSIGNAFFYVGTIEQQVKNDLVAARTAFQSGCQAKDASSCAALSKVPPTPAASTSAASSPSTAGMSEAQLWTTLEKKYVTQGVPRDSVAAMMVNMKKGFATMTPEQRVAQLRLMIGQ